VISASQHVRTNLRKIVEVASWAYEELPMPQLGLPHGMEKNLNQEKYYRMFIDLITRPTPGAKSLQGVR